MKAYPATYGIGIYSMEKVLYAQKKMFLDEPREQYKIIFLSQTTIYTDEFNHIFHLYIQFLFFFPVMLNIAVEVVTEVIGFQS